MFKKILSLSLSLLFLSACSGTFDSIKRGLTGQKANNADEFLVKKKDPLILPPDFENLPTPDEKMTSADESSIFQNTLENTNEDEDQNSDTVENSILKKIQSR